MSREVTITLTNQIAELERLKEVVEAFGSEHDLETKVIYQINLALDELLTNIISYGFEDEQRHDIVISLQRTGDVFQFRLEDDGVPFDPTQLEAPDVNLPAEDRRIGGLGVFFAKQVMDSVVYERRGDYNVVTLTKAVAAST